VAVLVVGICGCGCWCLLVWQLCLLVVAGACWCLLAWLVFINNINFFCG
jgi:hypothetical protein